MSTQPTPEELDALVYTQCQDFDMWHEGPSIDDMRAIMREALSRWGTPATGGEPVAWIRFQPPYRPDVLVQRHRPTLDGEPDTQYRPLVFGDTSPQPVREPLNIVELMRVVMKADEESQDTRGTTNWAAHIGKAVQTAVLSGGVQPVREPLTPERIEEICLALRDTVGCGNKTLARAIEVETIKAVRADAIARLEQGGQSAAVSILRHHFEQKGGST